MINYSKVFLDLCCRLPVLDALADPSTNNELQRPANPCNWDWFSNDEYLCFCVHTNNGRFFSAAVLLQRKTNGLMIETAQPRAQLVPNALITFVHT